MISIKINNEIIPVKIKLFKNYIIINQSNLSNNKFTKVDINSNNKIEVIEDDKIIKEYILNPIVENYKELLDNLKNDNIYCNVDIYEELIPFKYIIKKIDNCLYYESFSLLLRNNIEK